MSRTIELTYDVEVDNLVAAIIAGHGTDEVVVGLIDDVGDFADVIESCSTIDKYDLLRLTQKLVKAADYDLEIITEVKAYIDEVWQGCKEAEAGG